MARPKKTDKANTEATTTPEVNAEPATTMAPRLKSKMAVRGTYDIFAQDDAQATREALAKAAMADGYKTAADLQRDYLPIRWLALQYLIGRIGWPVNTVVEFIGQENTGKSSLIMSLLGEFILYNIPCYYLNTEPKILEASWLSRLVHSDVATGEKIKNAIEISERTYTLDEMDKKIRQWIKIKRQVSNVPLDVPLVIVVDAITKLLNPEEAEILMSKAAKADALEKGISDISAKPGVTAKWLHAWTRAIKSVLEENNVQLFVVSGQNEKMNGGASAFGADGGASLNKTRIGGTAINQTAAIQITITRKGLLKNTAGELIGEKIRARVVKNNYGPKRDIEYELINDGHTDSETTMQAAINMDETICDLLAQKKIMGIEVSRKRYTCAALNLVNVTSAKLASAINSNPEVLQKIGLALKISGYEAEIA